MMHPKVAFPGDLAPILADLASPLHARCRRDRDRKVNPQTEVSLASGYSLDLAGFSPKPHLAAVLEDWRHFMAVAMEVSERPAGFPIRLVNRAPASAPTEATEAFEVNITPDGCEIAAADVDGLRRAVFFLEDEMLLRRAPVLPRGPIVRWAQVRTRITRSPIAPYRWLSGWELEDENDYYPDEYLNKLAHSGVNGIWVAGLLRNLVASRTIPELGPPEHKLEKLKQLVAKAARHGIKVYFFCIEPRALTPGHPAGEAHPEIVGVRKDIFSTLCPSTPLVLEYVREAMRELFTQVPALAGVINIFCGERPTTCAWNQKVMPHCPRCAGRPHAELLGGVLDAFMDGIRSASPIAELISWTYIIGDNRETGSIAPMLEAMKKSDRQIIWMGNFEHGGTKEIAGKRVDVHEYALSYVGPAEAFKAMAKQGGALERRVYAKLQNGTSYEMSSVPYVPVPGIAYEKVAAMGDLGVHGTMLNWIPGGYPGPMLKAAGEAAFEPRLPRDAFLRRLAGVYWGESNAATVAQAWERMGRAWQGYPFDLAVLYWGPVTRAPGYQLHLERETRVTKLYNFGWERNREPQYFDDRVERWLGSFSAQEIIEAFRNMAEQWLPAANELNGLAQDMDSKDELRAHAAVATAVRLQCLATANVYEFYTLRDSLLATAAQERPLMLRRMREIAEQELQVAGEMLRRMAAAPAIGFLPELYAYSYSVPMLEEKIRQLRDLLPTLQRWEREGIEPAVLQRTVEEAERLRPDKWGD